MLTFAGKSIHDHHVICVLDEEQEYQYEVDFIETIKDIARVHGCHTRRACKMLRRTSMELPIRGDRCKYWLE